jgi:hypothetical protein
MNQGVSYHSLGKRAAVVISASLFWGAVGWNPHPVRAQQPTYTAAAPRFARFGKIYINLNQVTHVVSEPNPALPPGALQVYFGQESILLHGEDADGFRRLLDEGIGAREASQAHAAAAPVPAPRPAATAAAPAPAPAPAASGVAKKPSVRRPTQVFVP